MKLMSAVSSCLVVLCTAAICVVIHYQQPYLDDSRKRRHYCWAILGAVSCSGGSHDDDGGGGGMHEINLKTGGRRASACGQPRSTTQPTMAFLFPRLGAFQKPDPYLASCALSHGKATTQPSAAAGMS